MTVRQLYYRAEVEGLPGIDKTESGYDKIQRQVLLLRRTGLLPYRRSDALDAPADNLRQCRGGIAGDRPALPQGAVARCRCLCRDLVREGRTGRCDLPGDRALRRAADGGPRLFQRDLCFEAVEARVDDDRTYIVYYLGDFDRSGRDAAAALEEKLKRFAAERGVDVDFIHLAIAESDIEEFDAIAGRARVVINVNADEPEFDHWLPTREHKRKSRGDQLWPYPFARELDAIEPDDLRALVRWAIECHLPAHQLKLLQIAEASERRLIAGLVSTIAGNGLADDARS